MVLYDFLAPFYDPFLEGIYRPFRERALKHLPTQEGSVILDLACGTGQNFPLLALHIGETGKIIGVDISSGMLKKAGHRSRKHKPSVVSLLNIDGRTLSPAFLEAQTGFTQVDFVICTYGFTAMRDWQAVFDASYTLLKTGGCYLIHDIHAENPTLHSRIVEIATRCDFSQKIWQPLQDQCTNFHFEYLDPSRHLFGGRLFVASGIKQ